MLMNDIDRWRPQIISTTSIPSAHQDCASTQSHGVRGHITLTIGNWSLPQFPFVCQIFKHVCNPLIKENNKSWPTFVGCVIDISQTINNRYTRPALVLGARVQNIAVVTKKYNAYLLRFECQSVKFSFQFCNRCCLQICTNKLLERHSTNETVNYSRLTTVVTQLYMHSTTHYELLSVL